MMVLLRSWPTIIFAISLYQTIEYATSFPPRPINLQRRSALDPTRSSVLRSSPQSQATQDCANAFENRVCVVESEDFLLESIELAACLSLATVKKSELFGGSPLVAGLNDENTENDDCHPTTWEFALVLEPWEQTFALSIQSVAGSDDSSERRKRRPAKRQKRPKAMPSQKPFFVDFCPPPQSRLEQRVTQAGDLLVKAVGPRKGIFANDGAVVYDLTAGLGQDALLLAKAGAQHVVMCERNLIVGALLQDALRRVEWAGSIQDNSYDSMTNAQLLSKQLSVQIGDGRDLLTQQEANNNLQLPPCDIVYLDPMFPVRTKTAAVKKNMQILQGLLESQQVTGGGDDVLAREAEERSLLETAYQIAQHKIVVKRPIGAPILGGSDHSVRPSHEIKGSVNRWDVYTL